MKSKEEILPKPTEGELELLQVLWELEEATVRDLYEAVNRRRPVGYTSVLKQLQIMTEKGLVLRDETGRAHVYRTSLSQEATQNQFLKDLSDRLFSGSAAQLALHALSMAPASAEDLQEIRQLIEQKKGKR